MLLKSPVSYKGVSWDEETHLWLVTVKAEDDQSEIYCGKHHSVNDAAVAYDRMAIKLWVRFFLHGITNIL